MQYWQKNGTIISCESIENWQTVIQMGRMQMLKSMTGYGRGEATAEGRHVLFEIKSVNHKFFECNLKLPRAYLFLEDKLRAYVQSRVSRGKVDLFLQIETLEEPEVNVSVNHSLADAYVRAFGELKEHYHFTEPITLSHLIRCPDLLVVEKPPEDEDGLWQIVLQAAEPAVTSFLQMRETEGTRLSEDLLSKIEKIETMVSKVEQLTPQTVAEYRERLHTKIQELLGDKSIDEQRVLTEVAVFADKVAVDEETVRLKSHIKQLRKFLSGGGQTDGQPVGRKLDFLIQEMNREVNTIGSKSANSDIAYIVVDLKSEIEKIREQVQNIE